MFEFVATIYHFLYKLEITKKQKRNGLHQRSKTLKFHWFIVWCAKMLSSRMLPVNPKSRSCQLVFPPSPWKLEPGCSWFVLSSSLEASTYCWSLLPWSWVCYHPLLDSPWEYLRYCQGQRWPTLVLKSLNHVCFPVLPDPFAVTWVILHPDWLNSPYLRCLNQAIQR